MAALAHWLPEAISDIDSQQPQPVPAGGTAGAELGRCRHHPRSAADRHQRGAPFPGTRSVVRDRRRPRACGVGALRPQHRTGHDLGRSAGDRRQRRPRADSGGGHSHNRRLGCIHESPADGHSRSSRRRDRRARHRTRSPRNRLRLHPEHEPAAMALRESSNSSRNPTSPLPNATWPMAATAGTAACSSSALRSGWPRWSSSAPTSPRPRAKPGPRAAPTRASCARARPSSPRCRPNRSTTR